MNLLAPRACARRGRLRAEEFSLYRRGSGADGGQGGVAGEPARRAAPLAPPARRLRRRLARSTPARLPSLLVLAALAAAQRTLGHRAPPRAAAARLRVPAGRRAAPLRVVHAPALRRVSGPRRWRSALVQDRPSAFARARRNGAAAGSPRLRARHQPTRSRTLASVRVAMPRRARRPSLSTPSVYAGPPRARACAPGTAPAPRPPPRRGRA